MNYPDLNIHISRDRKDDWFAWAMALGRGRSYFCSALGKVKALELIVNRYALPGSDVKDPKIVQQAFQDAAKVLCQGWTEPVGIHFSSENQRRRAYGMKESPVGQENLEGADVTIWST